jgi:hypothetical protein
MRYLCKLMASAITFCFFLLFSVKTFSQVKIGGDPKAPIDSSAVLQLDDTKRGFLLPRLSNEMIQRIKNPADGLILYNTTQKQIFIYNKEQLLWTPLNLPPQAMERSGTDSCEWHFDTASGRVYLTRGLARTDSIYYDTLTRKFVFADSRNFGGTPLDVQFPGKYFYKGSASNLYTDENTVNFPSLTLSNILFEVDNDPFALQNPGTAFYNGLRVSTQVLSTATQKISTARNLNLQLNHTGADSVGNLTAVVSNTFVDGSGYTGLLQGYQTNMSISGTSTNNVGTIYGYRSNITRASTATGRVTGNFYGYFGNMGGFNSAGTNYIDGSAYGIFLGNVAGASPKRNFAFYSNKGHNRFGDSVLITDGFSINPRAVFDINSTGTMIIPSGTTAQRPADTSITAMFRFNTTLTAPEIYDGSKWASLTTGTNEWKYDSTLNRVNLVRGLPQGDSIYYNVTRKKFVFSDKLSFGNTTQPADVQFPGKYIFKGTASQLFNDSASISFPSMTLANILYEVDNDPFAISNNLYQTYNGLRVSTGSSPVAAQKIGNIRALNLQVNSASSDTVLNASGVVLNTFANGSGYTNLYQGYQTNMTLGDSAGGNFGTVFGNRVTISRTTNAASVVNGNVFGYWLGVNGFADSTVNKINGTAYGVFLNSITGAAPKRNYAFYSNKGHNRFGDSVLVTDQFVTSPRAVFDINATSAMITPNGTTAQRPALPVQAMLRFNNNLGNMEFYDGTAWKGLSSDSAEWKFDTASKQVRLVRGYPLSDSIFYSTERRQFLFTDRTTYNNSLGNDINIADFNGKYTFKTTASTSGVVNPSNIGSFMEADNNSTSRSFTGIFNVTLANPKRNSPTDVLTGISNNTLNTSTDSLYVQTGLSNTTTLGNGGYTDVVNGLTTQITIRNTSAQNIGSIYGIRNSMTRVNAATSSVNGNVFGYFGSIGNFNQRVNGFAYGIFLSNVLNVAGPRRNFAFYSNKGLNRLGDSTLITDGAATAPRAVLDVNATSAMIVPTGTTAQRPTAPVVGMVRYNTDNGGRLETYNGSAWIGTINGGIGIDVNNLLPNTGATVSFAFTGATVGSAVVMSPSTPLPNGIIIAWTRVSAANTIEVRFENNAAVAVNPPSTGFSVKVIQ